MYVTVWGSHLLVNTTSTTEPKWKSLAETKIQDTLSQKHKKVNVFPFIYLSVKQNEKPCNVI